MSYGQYFPKKLMDRVWGLGFGLGCVRAPTEPQPMFSDCMGLRRLHSVGIWWLVGKARQPSRPFSLVRTAA